MIIFKLLFTALAFFIASKFLSGVHLKGYLSAIILAILIGIANSVFSYFLPSIMNSSYIIVNLIASTVLIKVADSFMDGFRTDGWLPALYLSVLVSIISFFLPFA